MQMMSRVRFDQLGGYLEAPLGEDTSALEDLLHTDHTGTEEGRVWRLVHPSESPQSLRLAEDLRLFHAHLAANGILRRCDQELVVYRHIQTSQSSSTSRKLLLQLRTRALEHTVLRTDPLWNSYFVVWGAGRDGKD